MFQQLFPGLREGGSDGHFADAEEVGYLAVLQAVLLAHAQDLHLREGQLPDAFLQPAGVLLVLESPGRVVLADESHLVGERDGDDPSSAELGDAEVAADGIGQGGQGAHLVEPVADAPEPEQRVLHVVLRLAFALQQTAAECHDVAPQLPRLLCKFLFLHCFLSSLI